MRNDKHKKPLRLVTQVKDKAQTEVYIDCVKWLRRLCWPCVTSTTTAWGCIKLHSDWWAIYLKYTAIWKHYYLLIFGSLFHFTNLLNNPEHSSTWHLTYHTKYSSSAHNTLKNTIKNSWYFMFMIWWKY